MAIQVKTRALRQFDDLLLYVDVSLANDGKTVESFLAEVYEARPGLFEAFPSLPISGTKVFHSYGKRLEEWKATLALLDILLNPHSGRYFESTLERWLQDGKAISARSYLICIKVRHKGKFQDPREPTSRLANFVSRSSPDLVSPIAPEIKDLSETVLNNRLERKKPI